MIRYKIDITGAVQGVGFRPFVYRLATESGIKGFVQNNPAGVTIEAEGDDHMLQDFLLQLQSCKPSLASIYNLEYSVHDVEGYNDFEIRHSHHEGKKKVTILPDIAVCRECLEELFDTGNRRYRYPFINCTHCGPRFSIIHSIPYDRCNTSMNSFKMCPACEKEYNDPTNRRFHAQPNACPVCGPHIEMWNDEGEVLAKDDDAIFLCVEAIYEGKIIALKGLGGFQLITDAMNGTAINELRKRKHRHEKPFALMYPSLQMIKADCHVGISEERLLTSAASPIVLLRKKESRYAAHENVAPFNANLGVMLPYTPLHHLLMHELNYPVVATSGNISDEPICIDEFEALSRLKNIADLFLVHNRPVIRQVDDSVVRIIAGREQVLRRARGYAPLPIHLKSSNGTSIAVGAHLKNAIALNNDNEIFLSQHIGDLETAGAFNAFKKIIIDFKDLYEVEPKQIVCDLHPDYLSSKYARELTDHVATVQHHYAHVLSCMADNELQGRLLGVSWDGTGYGTDGTIWGSEFLLINEKGFQRMGHFRNFGLPGGEIAVRQPRRTAVGLLFEIFGGQLFDKKDLAPVQSFSATELRVIKRMLMKKLHTPMTSAAGRLFDAVASIIGLSQEMNFEGQAAMQLEFLANESIDDAYSFIIQNEKISVIDWEPMIYEIIDDVRNNVNLSVIATKFHNTLTEIIVSMAYKINERKVALTGGCFQNKYLTERTARRLTEEGFQPYWHQRIPPNDGGIAVGQVMSMARSQSKESVLKITEAV